MIIEDHHEMRSFIRESLPKVYRFVETNNGIDGISETIRLIPDIVICDVMMPGKDGFAVARALRNEKIIGTHCFY